MSKSVQFLYNRPARAARAGNAVPEVAEAAHWARALYQREKARLRFACDDPDAEAISRVARHAKVPRSKVHSLVRRPHVLKDISAGIYLRLRDIYQAECRRQIEALTHEIATTAALAGADHPDVRAAEALVAQASALSGPPSDTDVSA